MKRGKKGQFYLIAGFILAIIIVSLATRIVSMREEPRIRLYDLREEIRIEREYLLDELEGDVNPSLKYTFWMEISESYETYFKNELSHYFIFGRTGNVTVAGYQQTERGVYLNNNLITGSSGSFSKSLDTGTTQDLNLTIEDHEYRFNLNPEENFYFVISKVIGLEEHIITG